MNKKDSDMVKKLNLAYKKELYEYYSPHTKEYEDTTHANFWLKCLAALLGLVTFCSIVVTILICCTVYE